MSRIMLGWGVVLAGIALSLASPPAAAAVTCTAPEALLVWPAAPAAPLWEMCWLRPSQSSGPRGSGLELRNVTYKGHLVLKRAHSPMLFAEYTTISSGGQSGTCYRDWKDGTSQFIAPPSVRNTLGVASAFPVTTSCDRSTNPPTPVTSYGTCPFQVAGRTGADCFSGVAIESAGGVLTLTTQYVAGWYLYSSRMNFYADGSFDPVFGFGNADGTNNNITHYHTNYWRLDFDIDDAANDVVLEDDVVRPAEFASLRCSPDTSPACATERTWAVRDTVTGRGYRMLPTRSDYGTTPNQSGRGFHFVDVIGTVYAPTEYSDNPTWSLSDCGVDEGNLANGGDLDGTGGAGTDVVVYYRAGVRDRTAEGGNGALQDSMVCKSVGPAFVQIGDWAESPMFSDGFETP